MRLDEAHIAIRERTTSERLDLSLHVIRRHARPLALLLLAGCLPLAAINAWLTWDYAVVASDVWSSVDAAERNPLYYALQAGLVFLQAPLATSLITVYLGQAAFVDAPKLRDAFRELANTWWQVLLCQGVFRLPLPVMILLAYVLRSGPYTGSPWWWLFLACGYAALVRACRPFLGEIILLERNPFVGDAATSMTVARRNAGLHGTSSGELTSTWLAAALVAVLAVLALNGTAYSLSGLLMAEQQAYSGVMLRIVWPATLWLVAGFMAVFRYLSYLDLRIRHEGWEVELLLRAEGTRWQPQVFVRS